MIKYLLFLFFATPLMADEANYWRQLCANEMCRIRVWHPDVSMYAGAETVFNIMEMDLPGNLRHGMDRLKRLATPDKNLVQIAIVVDLLQCKTVEKEFDALMASGNYPKMCLMMFPVGCK